MPCVPLPETIAHDAIRISKLFVRNTPYELAPVPVALALWIEIPSSQASLTEDPWTAFDPPLMIVVLTAMFLVHVTGSKPPYRWTEDARFTVSK